MISELPLFPLHLVLFPGMTLPLHVFEPRYQAMMRRILAGDRTFGVALIKEGREVGEPAVPYQVGTTARVEAVERLPEGRMNLLAVGVQRFRLLELVPGEPYLVGRVERLDESPGELAAELAGRVAERFRQYLEALRARGLPPTEPVASEPVALSYQVARVLRATPPTARQRLLELPSAAQRLELELRLLRQEMDLLRLLSTAPRSEAFQGPFSRN